jgi:hypothetical protein
MILQDASADNKQPEVMKAALPDQPGALHPDAASDPQCDLPDGSAKRASRHQRAPLLESAAQPASSAPRFELAAAFRTSREIGRTTERIDDPARGAGGPLQAISSVQTASLAARAAGFNFVQHVVPSVRADLGFQRAISSMITSRGLGLLHIDQQVASITVGLAGFNIVKRIVPAIGIDVSLQRAISSMITSQNLGLLKVNRQLAESAAAVAAPFQDLLRNAGSLASDSIAAAVGSVNITGISAVASVVDLLRRWGETAELGMGVLRTLARAAYQAALRARAAVLLGEDETVAWFIETWLHLQSTPGRIEAVSAALLEQGWDACVPDDPGHLLTDLRNRTARQSRVLKPIWETQLNHRPVGTLDQTVTTDAGTVLTLADIVPNPEATEVSWLASGWEGQRLHRILGRLKPDELLVTNAYAQRSELTWVEAARIAGATNPAAMGERVRRKLKRLGAEDKRRLTLQPSGA